MSNIYQCKFKWTKQHTNCAWCQWHTDYLYPWKRAGRSPWTYYIAKDHLKFLTPPRLHLPSTKIIGLHHYIQFKSSENQTGLHVCACQVSTLLSTKKASCHPSFSPTDTLPHKVSTVYPGWPQTLEFKWSSCLSIPNYCNFGHVPILIFGFFLLLLYLWNIFKKNHCFILHVCNTSA